MSDGQRPIGERVAELAEAEARLKREWWDGMTPEEQGFAVARSRRTG